MIVLVSFNILNELRDKRYIKRLAEHFIIFANNLIHSIIPEHEC